jgi:hypothetical protein
LWRSFFPSYFQEKGKNLATKEDIAEITSKIEGIKANYTERLTAIEHQNALSWSNFVGNISCALLLSSVALAPTKKPLRFGDGSSETFTPTRCTRSFSSVRSGGTRTVST